MDDRETLDMTTRAARRFGLLSAPVALAGAALLLGVRTGSVTPAIVAAGLAALSIAAAWRAPDLLRPAHRAARRAGEATAWLLTWTLLAAVYFTAFTIASLFARGVGYDAMRRRLDRGAPTYWAPRPPAPESLERYFDLH